MDGLEGSGSAEAAAGAEVLTSDPPDPMGGTAAVGAIAANPMEGVEGGEDAEAAADEGGADTGDNKVQCSAVQIQCNVVQCKFSAVR